LGEGSGNRVFLKFKSVGLLFCKQAQPPTIPCSIKYFAMTDKPDSNLRQPSTLVEETERRLKLILARAEKSKWQPEQLMVKLRYVAKDLGYVAPEAFGQEHLNGICDVLNQFKPNLTTEDDTYVKEIFEAPFPKGLK